MHTTSFGRREVLLIPSHGAVEEGGKVGVERHGVSRLERALTLMQSHPFNLVVVSGGTVWGTDLQTIPLARGMADWLLARRPEIADRLIVEDQSRDTFENIKLSLEAIKQRLGHDRFRLTVITETEQGRRTWATLKRAYRIDANIVAPQLPVEPLRRILEAAFYLIHLIWPLDGGPLSEAMRRSRSYTVTSGKKVGLLTCLAEVFRDKWPGWEKP